MADKCAGACAVILTSWRTGEQYRSSGRKVLGCSRVWESVPHDEHDWYSNKSGETVHCYGHTS